MNKDTLKTLLGLAVIVVIIAGAFWYGDRQHQQQLSQNQKVTSSTAPSAPLGTPTPTAKPTPVKTTVAKATATTKPAATQSPTAQAAATPLATQPPVHTPTVVQNPTPTPVVAIAPTTGPLPQTGAASDLVPLAVLSGAWILYRRSNRHTAPQAGRTTQAI